MPDTTSGACARTCFPVLDALRLDNPVLIGHSLAGQELSYLAVEHPERIAGLVYVEAAYRYAYDVPGEFEKDFPSPPPRPAAPPTVARQLFTLPEGEHCQPRGLRARNVNPERTARPIIPLRMPTPREILQLLRQIRDRLDDDVSLEAMSARAGWSPFHFHRAFRAVTGETPKQYTLRLRLERAAARLLTQPESIAAVAAAVGFGSHEVFTRAFRRHFNCTPAQYRARARCRLPARSRVTQADVMANAGPCIGLFHLSTDRPRRHVMPTLSIERRELTAQPILFVRLRAARDELAQAIGQGVGKVYTYAQHASIALSGHPLTRYTSAGPGLLTIEVGFRVSGAEPGDGEVEAGQLPGGPAVVAMHAGPYDQLAETYAAAERWMEAHALRPAGAPWEWYVTDPAEHPDPADWRTEVFWPVAERS